MQYKETKPCAALAPYIHAFWELKGEHQDHQWERIFPDGCPGLVMNLGTSCSTDSGRVAMDHGKTYAVGAMTSYKDSFVRADTHLVGVCLKPAAFSSFFSYVPQEELIDHTVEFDKAFSFDLSGMTGNASVYLNRYFLDRKNPKDHKLQPVLKDIHHSEGKLSIAAIAKRNFITQRQLERHFKTQIGLTPSQYKNIVRFQSALSAIRNPEGRRSLEDIAFDCGFYDHAHLANVIRRNTGLTPSQL